MLQVVQNILDTERAHVSELQVSPHLLYSLDSFDPHSVYSYHGNMQFMHFFIQTLFHNK